MVNTFFFSSRRRHTRLVSDWSSDVCSSGLRARFPAATRRGSELGDASLGAVARASNAPEIGRASCRERVYTSLYAETFKINVTGEVAAELERIGVLACGTKDAMRLARRAAS